MNWTFVINKNFYFDLKNSDVIIWNTAKEVKKDDIIFVYTGSPYSSIGFVLKALTDPFEDSDIRKKWNRPAIKVRKEFEIPEPVKISELKSNQILKKWGAVRFNFRRSHFKMSNEEYKELKRLVIDKNSQLKPLFNVSEKDDFGIKDFLETFIEKYPKARENKEIVKDHELSKLFSNKFPKYLEDIANIPSITNNQHNYCAFSHFQGNGVWFKTPWTIIYDKELEKMDKYQQYPYYIHYILNEDMNEVYLALSLSWNYAKEVLGEKNPNWTEREREDYFDIRKAEIIEKLENSYNVPNDFKIDLDQSPWMTTSIIGKSYDSQSIPSEEVLENDFKELIKIYNHLIDLEYKESQEPISTTKHKIWKIAPGTFHKRQKMWPIFSEKGYIGVGWFLCEELKKKNYKNFKSLEDLRAILKKCANKPTIGGPARMIWNFTNIIKKGDIVVSNDGYQGVLGIGIIKSDYISPYESNKLNLDPDEEYYHFREVEWIIKERIEIDQPHFFAQQTITPINNKKWETIKESYLNSNSEINYQELFDRLENKIKDPKQVELIKSLYEEFNQEYLQKPEGIKHLEGYKKENKEVWKYYTQIKDNENLINETSGNIINYLLPIKRFSVAPVGFGDIKAVRHTDKNLPQFARELYDLINNLIDTSDEKIQKSLINQFKSGKYEKGVQTAVLSSVLYYLKNDYWYINNKTVDTFNLLSKELGHNKKINGVLFDYIDNLNKFKKLISVIEQSVPEFSDFRVFDVFCHWMCDGNLGNYARDKEKFENWKFNKFGKIRYYLENMWVKNDVEFEDEFNKYLINRASSIKPDLSFNAQSFEGKYPHSVLYRNIENLDYPYNLSYFFNNEDIFITLNFNKRFLRTFLEKEKKFPGSLFDKEKIFEKILEAVTNELRDREGNNKFSESLDLGPEYSKITSLYEKSTISAKKYNKNELPNESQLQSDFRELFESYLNFLDNIKIEPIINDETIRLVISENFFEYLEMNGFYFDESIVENFLLALKIKPFIILTGNAGTGKTKLAQLFAQYISKLNTSYYEIIPVGANWTENRHIVGYYNVISGKYQKTAALNLILRANRSNEPFFLILDEMNLSHVERYFSDFLSSMESGEPMPIFTKEIKTNSNEDISLEELDVPEKLYIPSNLFIIGTVNVDETTYMFSPKVLDRANTLEFNTPSAKDFMLNSFDANLSNNNYSYLQSPLSDLPIRDMSINQLKDILKEIQTKNGIPLWETLANEIDILNNILNDANFDFGFRTITEIIRFMYVSWIYDGRKPKWDNWQRYFDAQINQKMLPKIHGSHRELDSVLRKLFKHCYHGDWQDETWYKSKLDENKLPYPDSARKIQTMGKILQEKRYVSFTG